MISPRRVLLCDYGGLDVLLKKANHVGRSKISAAAAAAVATIEKFINEHVNYLEPCIGALHDNEGVSNSNPFTLLLVADRKL